MKTGAGQTIGWYVAGFRRYRPENRISRGLIACVPWVNLALLVAMYLYLLAPNVLQPGIMVRLPESPFVAGTRYGLNVVVLSREMAGQREREEIVFFDDQRYLVRYASQMNDLRSALARATRERAALPLILESDMAVRHGTLVQLFNMAADAGIRDINIATRPAESR
jgi:biopolymer transport protein ExbD